MNGIRPAEILDILRSIEEWSASGAADGEMVLATAVTLDGTVYSRAGAMAVFAPGRDGGRAIGAGEEGEFHAAVERAVAEGRGSLVRVSVAASDPILGYGFICAGRLEIFLEPLGPALLEHMRRVRDAVLSGEGIVCGLEVEGPRAGRRFIHPPDHPAVRECWRESSPELIEEAAAVGVRRTFLCPVRPAGKVLIFGSGPDAACLAFRLVELGFAVTVADPRPGRLRNLNWDRGRAALIEGGWEAARAAARPDAGTAVVIMTHSHDEDLDALKGALASPAFYIGIGGLPRRARELLAEVEAGGMHPRPGVLFAPAGLEIGAATPEESALAVAAELLAAQAGLRSGRKAAAEPVVKPRTGPPALPGLILAAGRGRRFVGGHKLSAELNGRPVLRHVVENALASRLDPVILVLGSDAEAALKLISGIEDPRLRVVFNPCWSSGKASSIEVGLRETPPGTRGVVSLLGDMPLVTPWLIDRIIAEFEITGSLVFPVFPGPEGPRKGYPTAFPRALFGEIQVLTGDDTVMESVRRHWAEAVKVPLPDASTQLDIDTPGDLELIPSA